MKYALIVLTLIFCSLIWLSFREKEFTTVTHSSSEYKAVVTYSAYLSWMPRMESGGPDSPGFIEIFNSKDESMGKVPIPEIMMITELEWEDNTVTIKDIAYWNFKTGECYWWDEGEKVVVREAKN